MKPQLHALAPPQAGTSAGSGSSQKRRMTRRVFVGSILSPESLLSTRVIKNGVLGVGSTGVIRFVEDLDSRRHRSRQNGNSRASSAARTIVPEREDETSQSRPSPIPIAGANNSDNTPRASNIAATRAEAPKEYDHDAVEAIAAEHGWTLSDCELVILSPNSFLMPGFIDSHVHAPQVPNLGRGQQYELLDWLENVTFPQEKKFEDLDYAYKTYSAVIQRMLDAGTTCAAIYATHHLQATQILATICHDRGMRGLVGKCNMDQNSGDYVEKDAAASIEATRKFVRYCRELDSDDAHVDLNNPSPSGMTPSSGDEEMDESIARLTSVMENILKNGQAKSPDDTASSASSQPSNGVSDAATSSTSVVSGQPASGSDADKMGGASLSRSSSMSQKSDRKSGERLSQRRRAEEQAQADSALVQPILTPRFAISCSEALLAGLAALASKDPMLRIQTHLSENPGEIAFTKSLFPSCETYTDVYHDAGLLGSRTILAHAIHLEERELQLIAQQKAGIAHCPNSNSNLRSGMCRIGVMLNRGIKVGLGTDMSGGFGLSLLSAIREASVVAKVVQFGKGEGQTDAKATSNGTASHDFTKGPLPIATLFYLATLGGAEVCSVAHRVGSLDAGKEFDALLVNTSNGCPNLFIEDGDTLETKFEKFLFCGDDRNIASVFVRGRVVGGSAPIASVAPPPVARIS